MNVLTDHATLSESVEKTTLSINDWSDSPEPKNIFAPELDSLQAIIRTHNLKPASAIPELDPRTFYTTPSVKALSYAPVEMKGQYDILQSSSDEDGISEKSLLLRECMHKLDQLPRPSPNTDPTDPTVVVLTGSTGGFGSHILNVLLSNPAVSHVYCLNRAVDSLSLQKARNKTRHLSTDLSTDRLTFCTCDLSKPYLGLQPSMFNELAATKLLVIHNAWPVNFNLPLQSFSPHLHGLVNLIDLVAKSKQPSRLFFISSLGSVLPFGKTAGRSIPERIIRQDEMAHRSGYAASKYLSETLLHYAAERLSISASFARVGQLTGAAQGFGGWSSAEWFPSVVVSSAHIGALPASLGASWDVMNWVPIDLAAEMVVELAMQKPPAADTDDSDATMGSGSGRCRVYHILNPHSVQWQSIRRTIANTISRLTLRIIDIVEPNIWIAKVREDLETRSKEQPIKEALRSNPAARLLNWLSKVMDDEDGIPIKWELEGTLRQSSYLRQLSGLKEAWMAKWVEEWLQARNLAAKL
ncbi:MAG: hypothetical protein Q9216_006389 [Gyalolechia sp. 2 TL-2023]